MRGSENKKVFNMEMTGRANFGTKLNLNVKKGSILSAFKDGSQ